jgi:hypothetical protein
MMRRLFDRNLFTAQAAVVPQVRMAAESGQADG